EVRNAPIVRDVILERTARGLASQGAPADFAACARLISAYPDTARPAIVRGMEKGLEGRRVTQVPPELSAALSALWDRPRQGLDANLIRFAARLGSPEAVRKATEVVGNAAAPLSARTALVELLGQLAKPESLPVLLGLLDDPGSPLVPAAMNALGSYQAP